MARRSLQLQSDPEKHRDRIITWRAALLSAAVVLMAGVVGATSSYIVADKQIQSQAQQSRDDFLREQRQAQYAKLISDADHLGDHVVLRIELLSPTVPEDVERAQTIFQAWDAFSKNEVQVLLLGGEEVTESVGDLSRFLRPLVHAQLRSYCDGKDPQTAEPPCDQFWGLIAPHHKREDYSDKMGAVVGAMKRELGIK